MVLLRVALLLIFVAFPGIAAASDAFDLTARAAGDALALDFAIKEGHYLYRDQITVSAGKKRLQIHIPDGETTVDPTFGTTQIYRQAVTARVDGPFFAPGLDVTFQGCDDVGICLPPEMRHVDVSGLGLVVDEGADRVSALAPSPREWDLETVVTRGSLPLVLLAFLSAGVALAFTPCMLPMYPVLAAIVVGKGSGRWRGLTLSLAYVIGMASSLALVGMAAGFGGAAVITAVQGPALAFISAGLFLILAMASFGVIGLTLPSFLTSLASKAGGAGLSGAFAMGLASILVLGPCVTAPMAGALIYIAGTGDVALGAAALFLLGVGQGLPLLAVGCFGSRVIPRPGPFMEWISVATGVVLSGMAIFVAGPFLPQEVVVAAWGSLLIMAGMVFGAFAAVPLGASPAIRLGRSLAILPMVFGGILVVGAAAGGTDPLRPLAPFVSASASEEDGDKMSSVTAADGYDAFRLQARPGFLVVSADWCRSCAAIERNVLADTTVRQVMATIPASRLDITTSDDATGALLRDLEVAGPPTALFFGEDGSEIRGLRLTGKFDRDDLLRRLASIQGGT